MLYYKRVSVHYMFICAPQSVCNTVQNHGLEAKLSEPILDFLYTAKKHDIERGFDRVNSRLYLCLNMTWVYGGLNVRLEWHDMLFDHWLDQAIIV